LIDSVTLSVINNAFVTICREMGTAMMRTSYSPIFNEGLDFSCMIFNRQGDLMGQAEFCPTMLGSCQYAMKWTIEELGLESFHPGDVVIHNDPYRGQCHMPEHLVVKPVFWKSQLWGFVGNIAHVGEIGGMAPGSFAADATEVYQEGLRLPPVKIVERGEYNRDVWKIILSNHRTPDTTWGDYHAMIGSLTIAERRLHDLLARYGAPFLDEAAGALLDYSERFMRAEIREIPNGTYWAEDCMEDDGVTSRPYYMRLKLVVRDDEVIADWTHSDPQARGPINATFVVTAAATYSGLLHVISDDIPLNSGCYRPIHLVTRPGTMVNVKHPGPSVGGNTETHPHIQNVVLRALAQAVPERVSAAEGATSCNFLFGGVHPETGIYYTNYHIEGSGWGGTAEHDGNDVQCPENGNCRNTPVEILETKYPFVCLAYQMRPDSGGPGQYRGGLASSRVLRVTAPEITVSALFDRTKTRAWGLFGGLEGTSGGIYIKKKGDTTFRRFSEAFGTVSDSKFTRMTVREGDEIMLNSAGGGGYGDPCRRPRDLVARDLAQGLISPRAARTYYGYEEAGRG
jgi:N-methylhydantoinase B/oxoprolinase/acetone carboxylase alpha subunit